MKESIKRGDVALVVGKSALKYLRFIAKATMEPIILEDLEEQVLYDFWQEFGFPAHGVSSEFTDTAGVVVHVSPLPSMTTVGSVVTVEITKDQIDG